MVMKRVHLLFQTLTPRMMVKKWETGLPNTCCLHPCNGANYSAHCLQLLGGLHEIIYVKNDKYSGSVSCYY